MPRDSRHRAPAEAPSLRAAARLRDPRLLFLLLGAGVFALDHATSGEGERPVIEVTADQVEGLRSRWTAQWGRPPTGPELETLVEEAVDEEILYREARRLGLDRDDAIVRRRLAQKLTFVLEDAGAAAPGAPEVEAYYARHAERYRRPRRTTFDHVFLSADRRADAAGGAAALLREIRAGAGWRRLGDPFMLARTQTGRTDAEIARRFGAGFAEAVSALPAGRWNGPVASTWGAHLVRVRDRTAPQAPPLDEVRGRVAADLGMERRREQGRAAYRALLDDYEVRLPAAVERPAGTPRLPGRPGG